uniref:Endodeoxyribonuclease RusA n=1 Tax=Ackermannviridae sp. TaxID=2831612 RepID=A0A8S5RR79_9CAUD|nr:MAG TPA: Endodeoxyribonuclease RusA [Ackermannviridae sp.]
MIYTYAIPLPPITKKNSPQIFYMGARCPVCHKGKIARVMPSAAYLKYERAAVYYLTPKPKSPINTACRVETRFYMPTRRRCDLPNHIESVHDILVKAKILADDDYTIVASVDGSRVLYDKEYPRTEIIIQELEE